LRKNAARNSAQWSAITSVSSNGKCALLHSASSIALLDAALLMRANVTRDLQHVAANRAHVCDQWRAAADAVVG
jgi:hypothetical protein